PERSWESGAAPPPVYSRSGLAVPFSTTTARGGLYSKPSRGLSPLSTGFGGAPPAASSRSADRDPSHSHLQSSCITMELAGARPDWEDETTNSTLGCGGNPAAT